MKNSTQKTAIFGGSFDPPHFGHVDIVKNLEKIFDRVIIMPSYISPFKSGGSDANARLSLCKKVFASQKTEVSRYEITKQGVSYSVDTAAYLAKKSDAQLYWVIGSEELTRLTEWHDIDRLKTLVTFFVVPRPGFYAKENTLKALKKRKIKIKIAKFSGLDISSSDIKIDLAFEKPNKYMPDCVADAVKKKGLFNPYAKYAQKLIEYGLKRSRIEHSYGVAVCASRLAKLYGANVHDAIVAGLLHDIAKSVNAEDYKGKVDTSDFPPPTVHAPIGAYIAKKEFGVSDEIADAIHYHTTGRDNMSLLDEIIYLADKTEQYRMYDEVYYIRYLCEVNKDYALYYTLSEVTNWKEKHAGATDCVYTLLAIDKYKKLCEGTDKPIMPEYKLSAAQQAVDPAPVEKKVNYDGIRGIANAVADELDKHKARAVDIVDLGDKTIIADYFVIASASSTTAVKSLMGYVEDRLKKQFDLDPTKRDVDREWVALDYGGVIVHIFTDKMRAFYNIERLWSDGGNIERFGD